MAEQSNALGYFVVGLGIGVAIGLLVAPRSGEETRRILKDKAVESKDYLRERAEESREFVKKRGEELKGTASELIDRSRDALARQKEQLSAAVEAGKQAYRESVADPSSLG